MITYENIQPLSNIKKPVIRGTGIKGNSKCGRKKTKLCGKTLVKIKKFILENNGVIKADILRNTGTWQRQMNLCLDELMYMGDIKREFLCHSSGGKSFLYKRAEDESKNQ